MTYEQIIQKAGKRIVPRVYYYENGSEVSLNRDDFQQAKFSFNASLVGTVMSGVELEVKRELPDTSIFIEITARFDEYTARKVYGGYLRRGEPTYNADAKTYTYEMYDKIITSMVDYKPINITYPTTVYNFFRQLVSELNFTTDIISLPNGSKTLEEDIYDGINFTYRDVLNDIGQATATLFIIEESEIKKCLFGTSEKTIDDDILKNQNITLGKHFGPINTIVLTRSAESDSIYYPETLPANPIEFRIADNQLMNDNNREEYLEEIYNQLEGIEFDVYDTALVGYGGFTPLEKIKITTDEKEYNSYVFNNEITITQGYEEVIYTEMPTETTTDFKVSDSTDKRLNQAYIIVNKLNKEIEAVVDTTNQIQKEINPTGTASSSIIKLEDSSNNPLIDLEIEGKSEQETTTQNANLFDEEYYNNDSLYSINVYKYTKTRIKGNRTLYTKCVLKEGKTSISNLYLLICNNVQPNISGSVARWLVSNGTTTTTGSSDFTGYNDIYFTWYPSNITPTQIFDTYNIMVSADDVEYTPFVPDSPSPDYPSEIESVGYENLCSLNEYEDDINGYFKSKILLSNFENNTTYTLSFDITASVEPFMFSLGYGDDTYAVDFRHKTEQYNGHKVVTFTTNNATYSNLWIRLPRYSTQTQATATVKNIMLVKGSKEYSYVTYGKYGIEVKVTGKNLWGDISWLTQSYSYFKLHKENTSYTLSVKLKPGKSVPNGLYLGFTENGRYDSLQRLNWLIENGEFKSNKIKDNFYYINNIYFSIYNFNYISVYPTSYANTLSDYFDIQLEYGNEFTGYQQYQYNTSLIVLNEPLRSLPNGTKDLLYIKNNHLYVDRYVGKVVLDGSESGWGLNPKSSDDNYLYWLDAGSFDNVFGKNVGDYIGTTENSSLNKYFVSNFTKALSPSNSIINNGCCTLYNYGGVRWFLVNYSSATTVEEFKNWLALHNTEVIYELAEPYTEELGEIEIPSTYKGTTYIQTTDNLEPNLNITYVRDTVIGDYVENHVAELKITESEIKSSVESVSTSVNGLNSTVNRVEEITNDNSQVLNIISTNIDRTSGEVREVTTTTGFTFNKDGMTIDDGSGFSAQHRAEGTYYKDGTSTVGQYTKDGSKQKNLQLFGVYSYGMNDINDTPMFIGQLYEDENGEECFGHFVNI